MEKKLLKNELDFYKWYFEKSLENERFLDAADEDKPTEYPCFVFLSNENDYYGDPEEYCFIYLSDFNNAESQEPSN